MHVPLTRPFGILDHHLEGAEVQRSHGIEGHIKENQGPLEERICRVCCKVSEKAGRAKKGSTCHGMGAVLTAGNPVDLVLDEEVDEGNDGAVETAGDILPIFDGLGVRRAQSKAGECPGNRRDKVGDHENVVPVVIVSRGHVRPTAAGQRPKDAPEGDELGQVVAGLRSKEVPQADEGESRTCQTLASAYGGDYLGWMGALVPYRKSWQ